MFPSSGTSCHKLNNKKSLCTISKRCSDSDSGYQPGLNDKNEEIISENTITNENMESIDYIAEEIEDLDSLHVNIKEIQLGFIFWVKYGGNYLPVKVLSINKRKKQLILDFLTHLGLKLTNS